jgi:HAD superfamily hydrolase (TIGR01509 family)
MIKALLFDFDGIIMDTESPEVQVWQEIFSGQGVDFPLDIWLRDVVGATVANFNPAAYLAAATGRTFDLAELHEQARISRLEAQSRLSALPGVLDILAAAKRLHLKLAIASSSPHLWVDRYLSQLGLNETFNAVICREDAPSVKPAPDLFLAALSALEVSAAEAVVFEDSPNGILAAKRAGLRVVAVPNPVTKHADFSHADLVLGSLGDVALEEILEKLAHQGPPGDR